MGAGVAACEDGVDEAVDAGVVSDDGLLHCPITARKTTRPRKIRTTFAQPDVRTCLAPHFGQASAFVLISLPHSLHFVIATTHPLCVRCLGEYVAVAAQATIALRPAPR